MRTSSLVHRRVHIQLPNSAHIAMARITPVASSTSTFTILSSSIANCYWTPTSRRLLPLSVTHTWWNIAYSAPNSAQITMRMVTNVGLGFWWDMPTTTFSLDWSLLLVFGVIGFNWHSQKVWVEELVDSLTEPTSNRSSYSCPKIRERRVGQPSGVWHTAHDFIHEEMDE